MGIILKLLGLVAILVAIAVYQLVILFRKLFQKLIERCADRPGAKKLRRTKVAESRAVEPWLGSQWWKFMQAWWERQHGIVIHPGSFGRALRRMASGLLSFVRRPRMQK